MTDMSGHLAVCKQVCSIIHLYLATTVCSDHRGTLRRTHTWRAAGIWASWAVYFRGLWFHYRSLNLWLGCHRFSASSAFISGMCACFSEWCELTPPPFLIPLSGHSHQFTKKICTMSSSKWGQRSRRVSSANYFSSSTDRQWRKAGAFSWRLTQRWL